MNASTTRAALLAVLLSSAAASAFAQESAAPAASSEVAAAAAEASAPAEPSPTSVAPPLVSARGLGPEAGAFELNPPSRLWALRASAELGLLSVLSHTIQLSQTGSTLDYVREGGQNNLAPFARISAEVELNRRHNIVFLYQPIDLRTQVRTERDLLFNNVPFARGTALDLRYGFDFYRVSYLYDFFADPNLELSVGLTFQLRNAAIVFTSADGLHRTFNNDVGLVPALKARGRYTFSSGWFLGFEIDGSYASIPGLNGSDIPVEGALLDASLRAGLRLWGPTELFLNVRYLGGGSRGVGRDPEEPGDGFLDNWLHTMAVSLGANLR